MICPEAKVQESDINSTTVVHPKVVISFSVIGERNNIEELSEIEKATIGNDNIISVRNIISQSIVGNNNSFGHKCKIINSKIGNNCFISPTVELNNVTIPDNTSVYLLNGQWICKPCDISIVEGQIKTYYEKLTTPESPHYMGNKTVNN